VCMMDDDCVKIEMFDSGNDGMCCGDGNGYYKAFYKGVEIVHPVFTTGDYSSIEVGECVFPSAMPSAKPSPSPSSSPSASPTTSPSNTPTAEPSSTPTKSPIVQPTSTPSIEPTAPICPYPKSLLHVVVQTDNKADENTLKIKKIVNGAWKNIVRERNFNNNDLTAYDVCVEDDECFKVEMFDSGNDGICCGGGNGYYKAFYKGFEIANPPFNTGDYSSIEGDNCVFPSSTPSSIPSFDPSSIPTKAPTKAPTNTPSLRPSASPSTSPSDSPSAKPTPCPTPGQANLLVVFQADANADVENKLKIYTGSIGNWEKVGEKDGFVSNEYNAYKMYIDVNKCYKFILEDTGNDGICCGSGEGYFKLFLDDAEVQAKNFPFLTGDKATVKVGNC